MTLSDLIPLASLGLAALVAVLSFIQTRRRDRQDLIESEQRRIHELDLAKNSRYQERVADLYLDVRAYIQIRFRFAADLLNASEKGEKTTTLDEEGEGAAILIRNRVALYASDRVTTALDTFHGHIGVVYSAIGAAQADAEILHLFLASGDDRLAELQVRVSTSRAGRQAKLDAARSAMNVLDTLMRSDLSS